MKEAIAKGIIAFAESNDIDAKLHTTYSGRGMFGRTTHGVTIDAVQDLIVCIVAYTEHITKHPGDVTPEKLAYEMRNLQYDTLGQSTIYY